MPWLAVDWSTAWLAPLRATGEALARQLAVADAPQGAVAAALNAVASRSTGVGTPASGNAAVAALMPDAALPRFVPQAALPAGSAYEAHIHATRSVPTRDNLHDFFNGLIWLHFPQTKRRLNALQAGEIARSGTGATRGPLRDALTLFDENGALLDAPPALWAALMARDWQRLFVTERALWREARLLVFGHALLEKLTSPRKPATAHVLLLQAHAAAPGRALDLVSVDAALAAALDADWLASKPFVPLPVLGTPGWWLPNETFSFYDDIDVFRPRRSSLQAVTATPTRRLRHTAPEGWPRQPALDVDALTPTRNST